jgi:ubiquinone/menaquinone biosynthesis C-methylase UbiE
VSGYDAELRRHNEVLRQALDVRLHDHVLDIGCGTGQTTRQAARTAQAGGALGVDISAPAIERARDLARAEGLRNVTFEHANAQVHRFPHERFDLATSRFGTMFFDDPGAAFANIRRALRPAGRLVMMVWQEPVYYGPDVSTALDWVHGFASASEVLKRLDPAAAARADGRLREALAAHLSDDGVWFGSRAWIVTAHRH